MESIPEITEIEKALTEAGSAHHEYEQIVLRGVRDVLWPGFYAAYILGKFGSFTTPSILSRLLESAPDSDNWANSAAEFIISKLSE